MVRRKGPLRPAVQLLRKGGMDGERLPTGGTESAGRGDPWIAVEVSSRTFQWASAEVWRTQASEPRPGVTQRNGNRSRAWDTRVGTMELHHPEASSLGVSYFPSRVAGDVRRSERALLAVIQQAYSGGCVSTRRVDDLVKALGCEGPRARCRPAICQELDVVVDGFLGRPLDGVPYPLPVAGRTDPEGQGGRQDGRQRSAWWWRRHRQWSSPEGKRDRSLGWTWVPVKTAPSGC